MKASRCLTVVSCDSGALALPPQKVETFRISHSVHYISVNQSLWARRIGEKLKEKKCRALLSGRSYCRPDSLTSWRQCCSCVKPPALFVQSASVVGVWMGPASSLTQITMLKLCETEWRISFPPSCGLTTLLKNGCFKHIREIKPRINAFRQGRKGKTTVAKSAVSVQPHFPSPSRLLHLLPSSLLSPPSLAPTPELWGGLQIDKQRDEDMVRKDGRLLLYWCVLLVYSLSVHVCSRPLMCSEWLRTELTKFFFFVVVGRALFGGGKKLKWPILSVATCGNKSETDEETTQEKPAGARYVAYRAALERAETRMRLMPVRTAHVPLMLLYSSSPFCADPPVQKHAGSSSTFP